MNQYKVTAFNNKTYFLVVEEIFAVSAEVARNVFTSLIENSGGNIEDYDIRDVRLIA